MRTEILAYFIARGFIKTISTLCFKIFISKPLLFDGLKFLPGFHHRGVCGPFVASAGKVDGRRGSVPKVFYRKEVRKVS